MDLDDLARWAGEKGFSSPRVLGHQLALLEGYERVWNYRSKARQGGAANVQPAKGARVYGLALEVDEATLALMDAKEGHPTRYSRGSAPVPVLLVDERRLVSAWLYQVTEAHLCADVIWPQRHYLDLIVSAARRYGFPAAALRALEETQVTSP